MKIPFEWECVDDSLWKIVRRAKVFNGWIVNTSSDNHNSISEYNVFIPDPNHEWEI